MPTATGKQQTAAGPFIQTETQHEALTVATDWGHNAEVINKLLE